MLKASVSNLELFRVWQEDEDLHQGWLLDRLLHRVEQTAQQRAGEMLHKALERVKAGETDALQFQNYTFLFDADCQVVCTPLREVEVSKRYDDLLVTGRVDSVVGNTIVDYKSGAQFDADRLLLSYQWRFYLDMAEAKSFEWRWFSLRETDEPYVYRITDFQKLSESWYPDLHADCEELVRQYVDFVKEIPALNFMARAIQ